MQAPHARLAVVLTAALATLLAVQGVLLAVAALSTLAQLRRAQRPDTLSHLSPDGFPSRDRGEGESVALNKPVELQQRHEQLAAQADILRRYDEPDLQLDIAVRVALRNALEGTGPSTVKSPSDQLHNLQRGLRLGQNLPKSYSDLNLVRNGEMRQICCWQAIPKGSTHVHVRHKLSLSSIGAAEGDNPDEFVVPLPFYASLAKSHRVSHYVWKVAAVEAKQGVFQSILPTSLPMGQSGKLLASAWIFIPCPAQYPPPQQKPRKEPRQQNSLLSSLLETSFAAQQSTPLLSGQPVTKVMLSVGGTSGIAGHTQTVWNSCPRHGCDENCSQGLLSIWDRWGTGGGVEGTICVRQLQSGCCGCHPVHVECPADLLRR
eukprot:scaffold1344_cov388-Prasinococcus_capsulatus_cf.AAC.4